MFLLAHRNMARLLLLAAGVPCLLAAGCDDPSPGDHGPAGNFITTARLVMTTGGKRTLCVYWKWNNSRNPQAYEAVDAWTIPPGDPHKCLGGAAKVAAIVRGAFRSRSIIPDRLGSAARTLADAPTQAFFAGGNGETPAQFGNEQAYLYDAPTDSWRGFSMSTRRTGHTVTALLDGRVLVAGGWNGAYPFTSLTSCEVFDPVALQLSLTGSMQTGRLNHAASLMLDGRVLITGGVDGSTDVDSAEIYDPATGQFTPAGSMLHVRAGHNSTTLLDGRVLITGSNRVKQAEVFDPATGLFTAVGSTTNDHGFGASATLLDSGQVLILGGLDDDLPRNIQSTASAELFDPATNQFTKIGDMTIARKLHCATLQADGTVFISGGITANGDTVASTEVFNPADNSFTPSVDLPLPANEHAGVLLSIE